MLAFVRRFGLRIILWASLLMVWAPTGFAASLKDQGSATANQATSGLSSFFTTLYTRAPGWIAGMIVFASSFVFANFVRDRVVSHISEKFVGDDADGEAHSSQDILTLVGRATYVGVLGVGITIALKIAGIDLTAILAAVGFGIGFAMQDIVMNFIAGILILINRQFTIGDFIQINDTIGQITEIQSRATVLKSLEGTRVIVPNASLFKNQVTSFTSNPFRRVDVPVGVDYRTNLAHASQVIREVLESHDQILNEPAFAIVLDSFGDSSINFIARFWVASRSNWIKTKSEIIQEIKKRFDAEGISIPFPIRTLVFDKDNEKTPLPTYPLSGTEMLSHREQRAQEEVTLAEHIAAAASRHNPSPATPSPTPTLPDEALEDEQVLQGVAAVNPNALVPAPIPIVEQREKVSTGAGFLSAQ